jgi:hypothetical protein
MAIEHVPDAKVREQKLIDLGALRLWGRGGLSEVERRSR